MCLQNWRDGYTINWRTGCRSLDNKQKTSEQNTLNRQISYKTNLNIIFNRKLNLKLFNVHKGHQVVCFIILHLVFQGTSFFSLLLENKLSLATFSYYSPGMHNLQFRLNSCCLSVVSLLNRTLLCSSWKTHSGGI